MSIITIVRTTEARALTQYGILLEKLAARHSPVVDNDRHYFEISPADGLLTAVWGRSGAVETNGHSVLAGVVRKEDLRQPWWRPGVPSPDGSYLLVRAGSDGVELITDFAGSRPIWYVRLGCGGIAASTAFEVLVSLSGDFAPNEEALGWFLSSGTSGPAVSWDTRIKTVPRNTRVKIRLAKQTFTIEESDSKKDTEISAPVDQSSLGDAVWKSLRDLDFDRNSWLLALSGGYDSRALIAGLQHVCDIQCITWGDTEQSEVPLSDAVVAKQLADAADRSHRLSLINRPNTAADFEAAARRFARYNDGRTDNCLGYIDGMAVWEALGTERVVGVIRGDEVLGSNIAHTEPHVLRNMRLITFSQYRRDSVQSAMRDRFSHDVPPQLLRHEGESVSRWRLRLRLEHEIPTVYSALNGLRNRFMESVSPLLTHKLITFASRLPDDSLDNKSSFHKVVADLFPDVPYATDRAILYRSQLFGLESVCQVLSEHLTDAFSNELLGKDVASLAMQELRRKRHAVSPGNAVKYTPGTGSLRRVVTTMLAITMRKPKLNLNDLTLRTYLARVFMEEMKAAARLGVQR
jgi:hypothetical protein